MGCILNNPLWLQFIHSIPSFSCTQLRKPSFINDEIEINSMFHQSSVHLPL